jgi:tetratricopeptide (TPR) repeat protein
MNNLIQNNDFIISLNNKMKQELLVPDIFKLAKEIEEYKKNIEEECETMIINCSEEILSNEYFNFGWELQNIKNYELMKKYYLMAIDKGNLKAMFNLGLYYHFIEKDYEMMKKYYLMATERGDSDAMCNLANYYYSIEKDYKLMKKYYLMAINKNHTNSMYNLALYYKEIEKDYGLMKKYYLMVIDKGDSDGMYRLGLYYKNIENN